MVYRTWQNLKTLPCPVEKSLIPKEVGHDFIRLNHVKLLTSDHFWPIKWPFYLVQLCTGEIQVGFLCLRSREFPHLSLPPVSWNLALARWEDSVSPTYLHHVNTGPVLLGDTTCVSNHSWDAGISPANSPSLYPQDLERLTVNLHFNHFSGGKRYKRHLFVLERWFFLSLDTLLATGKGLILTDTQETSRSCPSPEEHITVQKNRIPGNLAVCFLENIFFSQWVLLFLQARINIKIQIVCYLRACLVVLQVSIAKI